MAFVFGMVIIFICLALLSIIREFRKAAKEINEVLREDYIDTGKMVILENEFEFIFDDKKYVNVCAYIGNIKDEKYMLKTSWLDDNKELVANIKNNKQEMTSSILGIDDRDMLYRVRNEVSDDILYSVSYGVFCPEEELEKVEEYYNNKENYVWQVEKYIENEGIKTLVSQVDDYYVREIYRMIDEDKIMELECDDIQDECMIIGESKDRAMMYKLNLLKKNDWWYWDEKCMYEGVDNLIIGSVYEVDACKLTVELNEYIDRVVEM